MLVATECCLSYEIERQFNGTVEADDLYHTAGQKGQAKQEWEEVVEGVERVSAARNVSLVGAIMTKTGPRLLRGSVARGLSSSGDQRFHGQDGAKGG